MPATLADLAEGQSATIDRLELPEDLALRLMELGFLPGHEVTAAGAAPGGDPRIFRVDGAEIALRRDTAARISLLP
jgi:ferrous iron transport protein A